MRFAIPAPPLAALLLYILYGIVILGVVLILWWIVEEFAATYGRRERAGAEREEEEDLERRPGEIGDPERLAREGRYDEAIHALLLIAIARLSGRLPSPPGPACTSRELVRILPMDRESRRAFGELVAAVEASLFGGMPARSEIYEECRNRYRFLLEEGAS